MKNNTIYTAGNPFRALFPGSTFVSLQLMGTLSTNAVGLYVVRKNSLGSLKHWVTS
jgi:hypothetical protein